MDALLIALETRVAQLASRSPGIEFAPELDQVAAIDGKRCKIDRVVSGVVIDPKALETSHEAEFLATYLGDSFTESISILKERHGRVFVGDVHIAAATDMLPARLYRVGCRVAYLEEFEDEQGEDKAAWAGYKKQRLDGEN